MIPSKLATASLVLPLLVAGSGSVGPAGTADADCYVVPGDVEYPLDACGAASLLSAAFNAVQQHERALENLVALARLRDEGELSHETWLELAAIGADVLDGVVHASDWAYLPLLDGEVVVEYHLPHSPAVETIALHDLGAQALGLDWPGSPGYDAYLEEAVVWSGDLQRAYWDEYLRVAPACQELLQGACE